VIKIFFAVLCVTLLWALHVVIFYIYIIILPIGLFFNASSARRQIMSIIILYTTKTYKTLSCCTETARCFVSFAKSLKIITHWSHWQKLSYRKQIARQLRTQYVEDIYRPKYYTVTLKSRTRVIQGDWKRNHWIDHTGLTISWVIWRGILSWP